MGAQPRRVRFVAPALVLLLVGAAVLVESAPGSAAVPAPARVSIYGDSVLLGARDQLLAQFADQQVSFDAQEDRSLLGTIGLFQQAGPALGDVVVTDLGYNDGDDAGVFRERIDAAMAALAGVQRVIWLNQREWQPGRAGMNAELAAAAARYPNLEVVDWNAEVVAHPEHVYADGIHLTPAGQAAMAALVRQAFDRYVASLQPATTAAPTTVPTTAVVPRDPARPAPRPVASTGAASGLDGLDGALLAGGAVALVLVGLGTALALRRRRRRRHEAQHRPATTSSS